MSISIREAYGEALVQYGRNDSRIVVLDADVSGSTRSCLFAAAYPDRFFNMGIAEANMTAFAAGLASIGKIPFTNTFAVFISSIGLAAARAYGSYSKLPIKMVGAYGGMSDAFDGPSHHSLEDIAIMRALPSFEVFVPCDNTQVNWLVKYAIDTPKPMYLRMSRDALPSIYAAGEKFISNRARIVREGKDISIIACGLMVGNALMAAEALESEGISARVVDMFCIKPIDREMIIRCAHESCAIVSAEEHSIIGGLGSAIAEVLAQENCLVPMEFVGVADRHGECGSYVQLQKKYGLDADAIKHHVYQALQKKRA